MISSHICWIQVRHCSHLPHLFNFNVSNRPYLSISRDFCQFWSVVKAQKPNCSVSRKSCYSSSTSDETKSFDFHVSFFNPPKSSLEKIFNFTYFLSSFYLIDLLGFFTWNHLLGNSTYSNEFHGIKNPTFFRETLSFLTQRTFNLFLGLKNAIFSVKPSSW